MIKLFPFPSAFDIKVSASVHVVILITSALTRLVIAAKQYYAVRHVWRLYFQDASGLLNDAWINSFYLLLKCLFHGTKRIRL